MDGFLCQPFEKLVTYPGCTEPLGVTNSQFDLILIVKFVSLLLYWSVCKTTDALYTELHMKHELLFPKLCVSGMI